MLKKSERGAHNVLFLHSPSLSVHFFPSPLLLGSVACDTPYVRLLILRERERERETLIQAPFASNIQHSCFPKSRTLWNDRRMEGWERERGCGWLDVWEKDGVVCV